MPQLLRWLVVTAAWSMVVPHAGAQNPHPSSGPSVDRPCSFVTATQMAGLLGTSVTAATDDHFRCKYVVGNGWLEVKLMDIGLRITRDILDYDKAHGRPVPGVGDRAYQFGATLVSKLGDVLVVVDGSEMPRPPSDARLRAIALTIVGAIP